MTAQQLRNSILQQAIQGRLVPQAPNDEPASVDIDKSLYKGKITILEEDEYPFEIPTNWCFCRLQDVATTIGGYAFKSEELKDDIGTRVIRISDVTPNGFSNKNIVRYNRDLLLEQYEVHNNDILIAMTGGTVGKSLYVDSIPERLLLNQRVAIVRAENIYPLYLDLVIKSPLTQDIVSERKNSTNDNISMIDIKSFIIPLPPLAEQRRIVAKIEELMPLVEKYGKAQSELDNLNASLPSRLRQSILQEAIQGKLVEQDEKDEPASVLLENIRKQKEQLVKEGKLKKKDIIVKSIEDGEILFELPQNWCWVRLADVCSKLVDGDHNPPKGESFDTGYYMLSSKNVNNDTIVKLDDVRFLSKEVWSNCNLRTELHRGDVLLTTVATLGRSCVVESDIQYCFQRSVTVVGTLIYNYYLKYVFDSPVYQRQINDNATGTAQRGFYLNQVCDSIIPLPPLAEQRRIVAKIEELFAEIDKLK